MKSKHRDNNIIKVCFDCSNQRHKDFQEKNPECNLKPGDYVKIGVKDSNETEHMWFKVLFIDDNRIIGQLDNHPVVVTNISFGDTFEFAYKDVEEIYKEP